MTIERHEFLNTPQKKRIYEYFVKFLNERCVVELNSRFKALKQLQLRHEDNLKEVREDERIEREYI